MEAHKEFESALEAYMEQRKQIYHIPTNLGINAFKKEVKNAGLPKKFEKKLIQAFKKRSWMEYAGIARNRGTFPSHSGRGKSVEVASLDNQGENITVRNTIKESETTINVKTA